MAIKKCLNCDRHLLPEQKFCSQCGQSVQIKRFTLPHFIHEGFHAFTHADKGIFHLLKESLLRPGIVAKEYIAGKRKKYFNPFTFFLILAAFYVLSAGLNRTVASDDKFISEEISKIENPIKKQEATVIYKRVIKSQHFFAKSSNMIAMVAVPFFAFYFWLIFYKKRYNYSEHLVANLLFISFSNLAFSLIVFPIQMLLGKVSLVFYVPVLGIFLQWIYLVIAYKGLMDFKGFWPTIKLVFATFMGLIFWIVLTQLATAIYVYQNGQFMDYFKRMGWG
jgi:hypothetical protein